MMDVHRAADSAPRTVRTVVVGLDGSAESSAALRWAANLVGADGHVHAVAAVAPLLELAVAAVQIDSAALVDQVERDLTTDWTADVRALGVPLETHVVEDEPARALIRRAEELDADLVVVGVHAKPKGAPRTLGRVTAHLIRESDRPVAIVEQGGDRSLTEHPTVVADAGHGPAAHAVVRWAADFADRHGTGLSLVRAIPNRPAIGPDGLLDVLAFYVDRDMLRDWVIEDLFELADDIQASTERDLEISLSADQGPSGRRLIEASIEAGLIVVGRDASGDVGHVIPKALHHVLVHAPCPVVVVPPPVR